MRLGCLTFHTELPPTFGILASGKVCMHCRLQISPVEQHGSQCVQTAMTKRHRIAVILIDRIHGNLSQDFLHDFDSICYVVQFCLCLCCFAERGRYALRDRNRTQKCHDVTGKASMISAGVSSNQTLDDGYIHVTAAIGTTWEKRHIIFSVKTFNRHYIKPFHD